MSFGAAFCQLWVKTKLFRLWQRSLLGSNLCLSCQSLLKNKQLFSLGLSSCCFTAQALLLHLLAWPCHPGVALVSEVPAAGRELGMWKAPGEGMLNKRNES